MHYARDAINALGAPGPSRAQAPLSTPRPGPLAVRGCGVINRVSMLRRLARKAPVEQPRPPGPGPPPPPRWRAALRGSAGMPSRGRNVHNPACHWCQAQQTTDGITRVLPVCIQAMAGQSGQRFMDPSAHAGPCPGLERLLGHLSSLISSPACLLSIFTCHSFKACRHGQAALAKATPGPSLACHATLSPPAAAAGC